MSQKQFNAVDAAHKLVPIFTERAAEVDANDTFISDNYAELKASHLIEAGVPAEFGGGDADIAELCEMLRVIAQACSSTGLAFSMHTHQVAIPAWRWKQQKVDAVVPLLKRIADEQLVLLSSGGSDWIGGSGSATKVDGGYTISARKIFTSGAEAGDLLMTGALLDNEGEQSVIHFGVPMKAKEVTILDTWKVLGMRGTGSNDVQIDGLFIPDAGVAFSRKAGEWHPVFEIIATTAFPLIYSVYLGIAESARDLAIEMTKKKKLNSSTLDIAGRMETALRAAQLAQQSMIDAVNLNSPSSHSVNEVMIGRTLVGENAIKVVELAMELAGGMGFYRDNGLERRFRDIQAARYHPLQANAQAQFAGAMALGEETSHIF